MSSIPEQDIPQYLELKGKTIQKNTDAYNKKKAEYDQASAEYQKEMDAYNAELKKQQDKEKEREAVTAEYAEKLRKLEAAKAAIVVPQYQMVYDRSTRQYVEKPIDRAQRDAIYNEQAGKINTEIKKVQDKASSAINYYDFSQKYPGVAIGGTVRDQFKASFGRASLTDLYEKHKTQKEIEAEYNRRTSEQQARNAPRYTDLQKSAIESERVGLLFTPTPQTEAAISRAEKIKPTLPPKDTIFPFTPTMAEKTRGKLINVDTGQSIMGETQHSSALTITTKENKYQVQTEQGIKTFKTKETAQKYIDKKGISAPITPVIADVIRIIPEQKASKGVPSGGNPVALVRALTKQQLKEGVQVAKTPESEQKQREYFPVFEGTTVYEKSGLALLDFQARFTGQQEVPKTLYLGILEERGLPVTPLSKRIIESFASDRVKPTIKEARGKKDTVTDPITGKSFNRETVSGDIGLGGILGYTFKTVEQPTIQLGGDVQGPPQPLWTIPDAFGNPRTDSSGNPILLKSEEKAITLSERLAKKPSEMTIPVLGGKQTLRVEPKQEPQKTKFNELLETQFNKLGEGQQAIKNKDVFTQLGYLPMEAERTLIEAVGFITSNTEQYVDPFIESSLGLKKTPRPAPIDFKVPTSSAQIISVDYRPGMSFEQNLKLYVGQQSQYVSKQGIVPYTFGLGLTAWQLATGLGQAKLLLEGGVRNAPKMVGFLKRDVKTAEKEGIAISTGGKELGTFPTKTWDLAEPVQEVGFRKEAKVPTMTTEKIGFRPEVTTAKPTPFGKERIISYYFRQGLTGVTTPIISTSKTIKESLFAAGGKVKRSVINMDKSPNLSITEGRNVPIPNVTRPQSVFSNIDILKQNLEIGYQKNVKPFLGKMGEVWQGRSEIPNAPRTPTSFEKYMQKTRFKIQYSKAVGEFKGFLQNIKGFEFPKPKTPEFIKSAQRGWQGYKFMQQKRFETWKGGLPSFPTLRAPKVTGKIKLSEQMELFKQKRDAKKIQSIFDEWNKTTTEPKVTVPSYGKNFLNKLKTLSGEKEPWDFLSKVKPFQKLSLRKEFASNIRGGPIGKIKGITSRQEWGKLFGDIVNLPQTRLGKFPYRSKLPDPLVAGKYDIRTQGMLKDIQKLRREGGSIFEAKQKTFDALKYTYKSSDIRGESLRISLQDMMKTPRGIARLRKEAMGMAKRGKLVVSSGILKGRKVLYGYDLKAPVFPSRKDVKLSKVISDIGGITKEKNLFVSTQKAERFSVPFIKSRLGNIERKTEIGDNFTFTRNEFKPEKSIKDLIGEGTSLESRKQSRIQNILEMARKGKLSVSKAFIKKKSGVIIETGLKVNLPSQIKPIFKIPQAKFGKSPVSRLGVFPIKETEVEKMIRLAKENKPTNMPWKKVRIDKYIPKYPKSWESWKAVGLATGGTGALVATSTYQPQEASALPFSSRMVESGGQKLIQIIRPTKIPTDIPVGFGTPKFSTGTTKPTTGKPQMLVPPFKTLSKQSEETKTKTGTKIKLIPLEGIAIKSVQQSKIKTVQTPKIKTAQMPKFDLRLSTPQKTETSQTPKLREKQRYRTDTYQALRASTIITPKLAQKQSPKLAAPLAPKLVPRLIQPPKLAQPPVTTFRYGRPPPKQPPRTRKFVPILPPDEKKTGKKKSKRGYKADYLGNVSETKLEGIFKRQETTYGQSKINKLLTGDIRIVKGKKRETKRGPIKWKEGKKGDMFGFKHEGKKKKGVSFW